MHLDMPNCRLLTQHMTIAMGILTRKIAAKMAADGIWIGKTFIGKIIDHNNYQAYGIFIFKKFRRGNS